MKARQQKEPVKDIEHDQRPDIESPLKNPLFSSVMTQHLRMAAFVRVVSFTSPEIKPELNNNIVNEDW